MHSSSDSHIQNTTTQSRHWVSWKNVIYVQFKSRTPFSLVVIITDMSKKLKIGCKIPQYGLTQPILKLFWHICTSSSSPLHTTVFMTMMMLVCAGSVKEWRRRHRRPPPFIVPPSLHSWRRTRRCSWRILKFHIWGGPHPPTSQCGHHMCRNPLVIFSVREQKSV